MSANRLAAAAATAAVASALALAPSARAHAQLLGTSPTSGSTVQKQPTEVIFKFNQNVGGTYGAVRVYDSRGNEVDNLEVGHPDGNERWMGVGLKPDLPDGTYTATYRVISADTHIVYGGLVFDLGRASASSKVTVAGLIGREETGRVTKVAFGVVRALDYLTVALMAGGLAFVLLVWPAALATLSGEGGDDDETRLQEADSALRARVLRLLALAALTGAVVSVLGVLLQGASAAGLSLWSSLKGGILQSVLESRFGWVWGARAVVWLALGALLALWRARGRPPGALLAGLALGSAYLVLTPALAGHASVQSPRGVFFTADAIHVACASVWVGAIACLLLALPRATGCLAPPQRSRLLLATLARVSPLALAAVVAIALTGIVQAYIDVRSLHGLLHTAYGLLVLAKTALLLALIAVGWGNRQRVIPALGRLAARAAAPGAAGRVARRNLRGELALMLCVFAVTAALVGYAPPIDAATGPFATNTTLGPALLEMTVEPAKAGVNEIHLYLIDAKTGAQFTATKELTVTARLPAKQIGPLPLRATVAGPGHYIVGSAVLSPAGTWEIEVVDRVSEFEQHTRVVRVPIG